MKILFWGTDSFGIPSLEALLERHFPITGIVCNPDRPRGRSGRYRPPLTKEWGLAHGVPVFQPETLKYNDGFLSEIRALAEINIVIAYGKILPKSCLELGRHGSINMHGSLLPLLRGASPIESAILEGFRRTGVTIQRMNERMDAGDILAQRSMDIPEDWNSGQLREALSHLGAELLIDVLRRIESGDMEAHAQDESRATYCRKLSRDDARIQWTFDAAKICRIVRAFAPHWVAWAAFRNKRIRIWKAHVVQGLSPQGKPGEITHAAADKLLIATGHGSIQLDEVQPENRRIISARDFMNGYKPSVGELFL